MQEKAFQIRTSALRQQKVPSAMNKTAVYYFNLILVPCMSTVAHWNQIILSLKSSAPWKTHFLNKGQLGIEASWKKQVLKPSLKLCILANSCLGMWGSQGVWQQFICGSLQKCHYKNACTQTPVSTNPGLHVGKEGQDSWKSVCHEN